MPAPWPARGQKPWDEALKVYVDEKAHTAAVEAVIADGTVAAAAAAAIDAEPRVAANTAAIARVDPLVVGQNFTGLVYKDGKPRARRLGFIDVAWFGAESYPDGADYASGTAYADMIDSSTAINDALEAGKAFNLPVRASGRYRVDATIAIKCNVDFINATFVCNNTALVAVRVGSNLAGDWQGIRYLDARLGVVIQAAKTGIGWTGTSVGLEFSNVYRGTLSFRRITGFVEGFRCTAYGSVGFSYNTVYMGHLDNNKVNHHLKTTGTGTSESWVNENLFMGGSCSHNSEEGSAVPGTRHILLTTSEKYQVNNNLWIRTSLESPNNPPVAEYTLETIAARDNRWLQCRWEATPGGKVYFNELNATYHSLNNLIDGGYAAGQIVFTVSPNSIGNRVANATTDVLQGYGTNGMMKMRNTTGASVPIIAFYDKEVLTAGATEWRVQFGANFLRSKTTSVANPLFQIQLADGQISWGGGTAAVDTTLSRTAADRLSMGAGDAFRIGNVTTLPAASVSYRGYMLRIEGAAGVADTLYICEKNAADAYVWRAI